VIEILTSEGVQIAVQSSGRADRAVFVACVDEGGASWSMSLTCSEANEFAAALEESALPPATEVTRG
jgi:hypothetical protein